MITCVRAQDLKSCTTRLPWNVRGSMPDGELRKPALTLARRAVPTCQLTACARASLFHVSSTARRSTAQESSDSLDPATQADQNRASTRSRLRSLLKQLTAAQHLRLLRMPHPRLTLLSRLLQHSATFLSRNGQHLYLLLSRRAPHRSVVLRRTRVSHVRILWVVRATRPDHQALEHTASSLLRRLGSGVTLSNPAKTRKICRTFSGSQMR